MKMKREGKRFQPIVSMSLSTLETIREGFLHKLLLLVAMHAPVTDTIGWG
jgi:hypothetical protein